MTTPIAPVGICIKKKMYHKKRMRYTDEEVSERGYMKEKKYQEKQIGKRRSIRRKMYEREEEVSVV